MKRILFYKERFYPKELLTTLLQICNVEKKNAKFQRLLKSLCQLFSV